MSTSKLRKTVSGSGNPCPERDTALLMIYTAVEKRDGLIHGKLHDGDNHCAIGSYWDDNPNLALPGGMVDEVAMVNDSVPHMTAVQRRAYVLKWLKWQLQKRGVVFRGRKIAGNPAGGK